MLRVLFAPGCYGTYILSCLCNYTTLMPRTSMPVYDKNGSSHYFREFLRSNASKIKLTHAIPQPNDINEIDKMVVIKTSPLHILDYINNQNIKNGYKLDKVFLYILPNADDKLRSGWNYNTFDSAPKWVLREFISYNIQSIMDNYTDINNANGDVTFNTADIFDNFMYVFENMTNILEIDITQPLNKINRMHNDFVQLQYQHNIQIRCDNWVNDIINNINTKTPCTTIFDEAYVQSQLRSIGHELKCDGLDIFPNTSHGLISYMYNKHHDT